MANSKSNINRNIASIVCDRQQELQHTVHNNWWYGKTKTATAIKLMREICFYLTLVVNFIILSGYTSRYNRLLNASYAANDRAALSNAITAFGIGTLLLIAGYVIQKFCKDGYFGKPVGLTLCSFILTTLGSLQLGITSTGVLITNHLKNMYATSVIETVSDAVYFKLFGLHIIPLLLIILSALLFYLGARLDKREKKELYNKLTDRLYTEFTSKNPSYSQKDWESYLDNYNTDK